MKNPLRYFAELKDPRVERNREHLLDEILLIAISSVLERGRELDDMEEYGKAKIDWLKTFLRLPSGIPAHDTFNRVFCGSVSRGAGEGISDLGFLDSPSRQQGKQWRIDGKSLRGTRQPGEKAIVHMVSAWACANNLVLGQCKVDEKSNEIGRYDDNRAQFAGRNSSAVTSQAPSLLENQ